MSEWLGKTLFLVMKDPTDQTGSREWHFRFKFHGAGHESTPGWREQASLVIPEMGRHVSVACNGEQEEFVRSHFFGADPGKVSHCGRVKNNWVGSWSCSELEVLIDYYEKLTREHGASVTSKNAAYRHYHPNGYNGGLDGGFKGW